MPCGVEASRSWPGEGLERPALAEPEELHPAQLLEGVAVELARAVVRLDDPQVLVEEEEAVVRVAHDHGEAVGGLEPRHLGPAALVDEGGLTLAPERGRRPDAERAEGGEAEEDEAGRAADGRRHLLEVHLGHEEPGSAGDRAGDGRGVGRPVGAPVDGRGRVAGLDDRVEEVGQGERAPDRERPAAEEAQRAQVEDRVVLASDEVGLGGGARDGPRGEQREELPLRIDLEDGGAGPRALRRAGERDREVDAGRAARRQVEVAGRQPPFAHRQGGQLPRGIVWSSAPLGVHEQDLPRAVRERDGVVAVGAPQRPRGGGERPPRRSVLAGGRRLDGRQRRDHQRPCVGEPLGAPLRDLARAQRRDGGEVGGDALADEPDLLVEVEEDGAERDEPQRREARRDAASGPALLGREGRAGGRAEDQAVRRVRGAVSDEEGEAEGEEGGPGPGRDRARHEQVREAGGPAREADPARDEDEQRGRARRRAPARPHAFAEGGRREGRRRDDEGRGRRDVQRAAADLHSRQPGRDVEAAREAECDAQAQPSRGRRHEEEREAGARAQGPRRARPLEEAAGGEEQQHAERRGGRDLVARLLDEERDVEGEAEEPGAGDGGRDERGGEADRRLGRGQGSRPVSLRVRLGQDASSAQRADDTPVRRGQGCPAVSGRGGCGR
ncbi:MAG: hypothetical protein U0599_24230 [Vicinamibacteria bacterium]